MYPVVFDGREGVFVVSDDTNELDDVSFPFGQFNWSKLAYRCG